MRCIECDCLLFTDNTKDSGLCSDCAGDTDEDKSDLEDQLDKLLDIDK